MIKKTFANLGCGKFVKKSNDFFYHCGDLGKLYCEECEKKQTAVAPKESGK